MDALLHQLSSWFATGDGESLDILDRAIEFLTAFPLITLALLFWILPRLFGGRSTQREADAESRQIRREQQDPAGEPSTTSLEDLFRGAGMIPTREERREAERESRFGSAFSNEYGKTKFGFDDNEWGSAFGDKKDSEPTVR